ncbi:MAG: SDR family oxidoreductase [Chitinophagaceae bacterium]|nr:MAG: SDR family oxidoreductase [Chitinophagaceae bacterium]
MKKVLIAGATGYLGNYVAQAFKEENYYTKVMVRNLEKFKEKGINADEIIQAEITRPETLINICDDVDIVFTSVGITRQKDGFTYHDVDFQGNLNLLNEASKRSVEKFMYVSVYNGEKFKNLKICEAKEKFVEALRSSGLDYRVIRPTGYFSDMSEYFGMAQKGKVYIFGNGNNQINPISGKDLAKFCISAINTGRTEPEVEGPETFTHNQIANLAFEVLGKPRKIIHLPMGIVKGAANIMRWLMSSKTYGPFEFVATILSQNMVAPSFGSDKLENHFKSLKP